MTSYESISSETKKFLDELNKLLRKKGFYINFHNGTLHNVDKGYVGALEDMNNSLFILEDETGEILYESKIND